MVMAIVGEWRGTLVFIAEKAEAEGRRIFLYSTDKLHIKEI
jgi:hypothetical protein